jgi:hypothetical protein
MYFIPSLVGRGRFEEFELVPRDRVESAQVSRDSGAFRPLLSDSMMYVALGSLWKSALFSYLVEPSSFAPPRYRTDTNNTLKEGSTFHGGVNVINITVRTTLEQFLYNEKRVESSLLQNILSHAITIIPTIIK